MKPDETERADNRTPNEKKTGKVVDRLGPGKDPSPYGVRQALGSVEAMQKYDNYLKEHKSRLRQLRRVANGDMAPSSQSYT